MKINMKKKIFRILRRNLTRISPTISSKILYRKAFNKKLNLKNPKTFNEKLQWLKLYWPSKLKTICADKYEVTNYARENNCEEIVNEIYGIYNCVEEINWNELPDKFALKCTHGCGANIICNNKNNLNIKESIKKLNGWMKQDYSLEYAEIHYKNIKPRIICEKYLETDTGVLPIDYKVFCFNGIPKITMVCSERKNGIAKYYLYDNDWNLKPYNKSSIELINRNESKNFENRPSCFKEMLKYAKKLSKPFPFVRIDFYEIRGKIILGEMTFTPCGCLDNNLTIEAEIEMGNMIKLP